MCGLIGMCGDLGQKHKAMLADLLYLNTLRGKDSTGLAVVRRDRKVDIRKLTVPGYEFIDLPFYSTMQYVGDQLWLGHGRYKTQGDVNRHNAHPFEVIDDDGFISHIGAHNGTLTNKHEIEAELKLKPDCYGTDSEALINLIAKVGAKEAVAKADGAWSLVWWDATANTINFLRNDQRPMCAAFVKDRKVLVWASEAWMIHVAASRNGVDLEPDTQGNLSWSSAVDTLYTIEIPQARDEAFGKFTKKGGLLAKPKKSHFSHVGYHYGNGYSYWDKLDEKTKKEEDKELARKVQQDKGTQLRLVDKRENGRDGLGYTGYKGKQLSIAEMLSIKAKGCTWCGEKILGTKLAWVDEDLPVCEKCLHGTHYESFETELKQVVNGK